jgi:CRISPR/Cas system-associated exonuclease Cas4 (RecB family)
MHFLDHLAANLKARHGDQLADLAIVLPTRRAALFLRESLARTYQTTLWSPKILSIQDFVRELTPWQFPEQLVLIFELYQVYRQHMKTKKEDWYEPFERFYAWGEMLLRDFDEVDKYLVDAEALFQNVSDLKELEATFGLSEEDQKSLDRFWRSVLGVAGEEEKEEAEGVKKEFLTIWEELGTVYQKFRVQLEQEQLAYDGMAYRRIVEQLKAESLDLPYRQVVFAGFNALSLAEQQIMQLLLKAGQAEVFWDVDKAYYPTDPDQSFQNWQYGAISEEAGKFVRQFHPKWKGLGSHLIAHDMASETKDIHLVGVPLKVGQAQYVGQQLAQQAPAEQHLRQYAVVLADESLLFPMLYAMPQEVARLNITMGFPLRQTAVFQLLDQVSSLLKKQESDSEGQGLFPATEVLSILNNPYLKALAPEQSEALQEDIRKRNLISLPMSYFQQESLPEWVRYIFQPPRELKGATPYLDGLFDRLLKDSQERQSQLETEYIFHFFTLFNRLKDILDRYDAQLDLSGFSDIFKEVMRKGRIPFEGEPLAGLQLMGMLETRSLDFEHLYLIGANEGSLPDDSSGNSFIPYHLRKGFGMPTFEEKDAIFAYHLFRLIQRARHVHLVYNSNIADTGSSGEMSRYLQQIRHFAHLFPHFTIHETQMAFDAPFLGAQAIRIPKEEPLQQLLQQRYLGKSGSYFSATALTTYLACPLKFYFQYLARLKEPETLDESMAANTLGTVVHAVMEYLYRPYEGKQVGEPDFQEMKDRMEEEMRKAFDEENLGWDQQLQGKNLLLREVIERIGRQILQQDAGSEPFEIQSLEEAKAFGYEKEIGGKKLKFNGLFDRVDHLIDSGHIRILDYKTGKLQFKKAYSVEEVFEQEKWENSTSFTGLKEAFQGYFYAWLYSKRYPENHLKVGYYAARSLGQGIIYLNEGAPLSDSQLQAFEQQLEGLMAEIFSAQPFSQTPDEKRCTYCPYRGICNREGR